MSIRFTKRQQRLQYVSKHASYGVISPAPCRGFVVSGTYIGNELQTQCFRIAGLVFREMPCEVSGERTVDLIPLYMRECHAEDPSGGLCILEHNDWDHYYYSVVWCDWPASEDGDRLRSAVDHVTVCARQAFEREQAEKASWK